MNGQKPENNRRTPEKRPSERTSARSDSSSRRSAAGNSRASEPSARRSSRGSSASSDVARQRNTSPRTRTEARSNTRTSPQTERSRSSRGQQDRGKTSRQGATQSYNAPSLWTKNAPVQAGESSIFSKILSTAGRFFLFIAGVVLQVFRWVFHAFASLLSRSRVALIIVVAVIVLGVGSLVDLGINWGKAYSGVRIGEVDVSGKSEEDIKGALEQTYADRLAQGNVTIYANEQAATHAIDELARAQDASTAELQSVEEAQANKQLWLSDAQQLNALLPLDDLVNEALSVGREQGGIPARIGAFFGGWTVPIRAQYGADELENLAADIDATLGSPRVDFNVAVNDGVAEVTEGHDGNMVDRQKFSQALDRALLESGGTHGSFIAQIEYAPLRVNHEAAQVVSDEVNASIAQGARFIYEGSYWDAAAADLGKWITTTVELRDNAWCLVPSIDERLAKPSILAQVKHSQGSEVHEVTFSREGDQVRVHTTGDFTIPLVEETVRTLNEALFGAVNTSPEGSKESAQPTSLSEGQPIEVSVASGSAPATSTFDEALSYGLISQISTYTTEYVNKEGTENRNHNIHLVSDLLNNSIVKPDSTWSFNNTSGECNEEKGFRGAGAIINGEYDDAIGGGICQVATTVFNTIFDSGFPVINRYNHSLYMSSYPAGRDAAVSWDELDFVWKNDSSSDVLLRADYTDTSVTIMLYGVNPGYQVSSSVGEWSEGEKFKTKVEVNKEMAPGTSYVKTSGQDGKSITVIRTVTSISGDVLHEDPFYSNYRPLNEVVVAAPGVEIKQRSVDL